MNVATTGYVLNVLLVVLLVAGWQIESWYWHRELREALRREDTLRALLSDLMLECGRSPWTDEKTSTVMRELYPPLFPE